MAGYTVERPKRVGWLARLGIAAGVAAAAFAGVAYLTDNDKTPAPSPAGPATPSAPAALAPSVPAVETAAERPLGPMTVTRVTGPYRPPAYYIYAAHSLNIMTYSHGKDAEAVSNAALKACEIRRADRLAKGAYVSAEPCKLFPEISNRNHTCGTIFISPQASNPLHFLPSGMAEAEREASNFLHTAPGRIYNQRYYPEAVTLKMCVDYHGTPDIKDIGYAASRQVFKRTPAPQ